LSETSILIFSDEFHDSPEQGNECETTRIELKRSTEAMGPLLQTVPDVTSQLQLPKNEQREKLSTEKKGLP
jgi:hypothetical protein